MNRLQTLLAATDLSAHAERAARRAAILARSSGARLQLLHVLDERELAQLEAEAAFRSADLSHAWEDLARRELQALAQDLSQAHGVVVQPQACRGQPFEEIVAAALLCDLLVLGAQGQHALRDFFVGTTADRLARKAPCPLLVVRDRPAGPYERVLVPTDLGPHDEELVEAAMLVAPQASAVALHVAEFPFEGRLRLAGARPEDIDRHRAQAGVAAREHVQSVLERAGVPEGRVLVRIAHGDPARAVCDQALEMAADLVVMRKRSTSALGDWLLGSVTRHVMAQVHCDVLMLPAPDA